MAHTILIYYHGAYTPFHRKGGFSYSTKTGHKSSKSLTFRALMGKLYHLAGCEPGSEPSWYVWSRPPQFGQVSLTLKGRGGRYSLENEQNLLFPALSAEKWKSPYSAPRSVRTIGPQPRRPCTSTGKIGTQPRCSPRRGVWRPPNIYYDDGKRGLIRPETALILD